MTIANQKNQTNQFKLANGAMALRQLRPRGHTKPLVKEGQRHLLFQKDPLNPPLFMKVQKNQSQKLLQSLSQ